MKDDAPGGDERQFCVLLFGDLAEPLPTTLGLVSLTGGTSAARAPTSTS